MTRHRVVIEWEDDQPYGEVPPEGEPSILRHAWMQARRITYSLGGRDLTIEHDGVVERPAYTDEDGLWITLPDHATAEDVIRWLAQKSHTGLWEDGEGSSAYPILEVGVSSVTVEGDSFVRELPEALGMAVRRALDRG